MTTGRNIAQIAFNSNEGIRTTQITVTDVWSQKTLYQGDFSIAMRLSIMEPDQIAVFQPSGEFRVLDVSTGKLLLDQKLDPVNELREIQTLRAATTCIYS